MGFCNPSKNPLIIVTGREEKWAMSAKKQIEEAIGAEIILNHYDRSYKEKEKDKNYISTGKLKALLNLGIDAFFEDDPRFWKHYIDNGITIYTFMRRYNRTDIGKIMLNDYDRRWALKAYDNWDQLLWYWNIFDRGKYEKII